MPVGITLQHRLDYHERDFITHDEAKTDKERGMGRKIFVSYKYSDALVEKLAEAKYEATTVRHYVDELQDILDEEDHINKGEDDGEDLSDFKDEAIESRLRDKIYDSSMTIVVISKGMKESFRSESDQWIPWEISYSLREASRNDRKKQTGAMLAVVLPDETGSYGYYITDQSCPSCKCRTLNTPILFKMLSQNMFNVKKPDYSGCDKHSTGSRVYIGASSYIYSVKWSDFKRSPNKYIADAYAVRDNVADYDLVKKL
ncbi:TIR domain-containing protein [Caballeronia sp. LjRoot34]|uniref:TIR domain-containing protein n=1 Tax=Caballeronia sp. LjRoot34 TaxID=3342325 RepID=UPI003ECCBAB3